MHCIKCLSRFGLMDNIFKDDLRQEIGIVKWLATSLTCIACGKEYHSRDTVNGGICLRGKGVYVLRASDCYLDRTAAYQKHPDTTLHFQRINTQGRVEWDEGLG